MYITFRHICKIPVSGGWIKMDIIKLLFYKFNAITQHPPLWKVMKNESHLHGYKNFTLPGGNVIYSKLFQS